MPCISSRHGAETAMIPGTGLYISALDRNSMAILHTGGLMLHENTDAVGRLGIRITNRKHS